VPPADTRDSRASVVNDALDRWFVAQAALSGRLPRTARPSSDNPGQGYASRSERRAEQPRAAIDLLVARSEAQHESQESRHVMGDQSCRSFAAPAAMMAGSCLRGAAGQSGHFACWPGERRRRHDAREPPSLASCLLCAKSSQAPDTRRRGRCCPHATAVVSGGGPDRGCSAPIAAAWRWTPEWSRCRQSGSQKRRHGLLALARGGCLARTGPHFRFQRPDVVARSASANTPARARCPSRRRSDCSGVMALLTAVVLETGDRIAWVPTPTVPNPASVLAGVGFITKMGNSPYQPACRPGVRLHGGSAGTAGTLR
jgi:hypothetical protein